MTDHSEGEGVGSERCTDTQAAPDPTPSTEIAWEAHHGTATRFELGCRCPLCFAAEDAFNAQGETA